MRDNENRSNFVVEIKGLKCTEISWCVEPSDVDGLWDGSNEEEIETAIEEIVSTLPVEKYFPLPIKTCDVESVNDFVNGISDKLSDEYGFLVYGLNYCLIGADGKEHEFLAQ